MPYQLFHERLFVRAEDQSPFIRRATWFQDIVIRCVRYSFANIPAAVGAVFFSKNVALPFFRFRMLRHGYLHSPIHWEEIRTPKMNGLLLIHDPARSPDVIVYYCHGGGFSMGSSYFYLEFLLAWVSLLKTRCGYQNPALFALEYTIVPTATHPTQLNETMAGYDYVLSLLPSQSSLGSSKSGSPETTVAAQDTSRVCLAGDSAGATLMLSLLLRIANDPAYGGRQPGFATMISPWCVLVSKDNRNTQSDYLDAETLHMYGRQYAGADPSVQPKTGSTSSDLNSDKVLSNALVSPGSCKDVDLWVRAAPRKGYHFIFGAEEVFAPETRKLISLLREAGSAIEVTDEKSQIHAWPVVDLFLGAKREVRLKGLTRMVDVMKQKMSTF